MPKSQVYTVTTTPSIVVPALIGDQSAYLHAGSSAVYIGGSDLTTANGYLMDHKDKLSVLIGDHEALYAVTSSGTATLYVLSQIN
jgi:hypothetical protein